MALCLLDMNFLRKQNHMKKVLFFIMICCLLLFITACGKESLVLKTGDPAPDFSLVDLKGKTWVLSELRGQVVFINFWATWCPPCMEELPSMQKLYTILPKDKFKMLAILSQDKPVSAEFITGQKGITIPVLDDSQNTAGSKYDLTGLPETFIVGKQGIIREKVIGSRQWDKPGMVQMMMEYIEE